MCFKIHHIFKKMIFPLLTISASKQAIMFSISDWYIYGNYAFAVATVCLMPCWLILWHVVNSQKTENIQENTDTLTLESKKDQ